MINVFIYNSKNHIEGFKIGGHSGFYKKLGYRIKKIINKKLVNNKDYICSAVSAVAYMALIGLTEVSNKKLYYKQNSEGFLECRLKEKPDDRSELLFKSFLKSIKRIDKEYPGHIRINLEEKNGS